MIVVIAQFACPVGSGRRSIYQRDMVYRAVVPYLLRILHVEMMMDGIIKFGGIGACADMKYKVHRRLIGMQPGKEILPLHLYGKLFALQVGDFIGPGKIIYE